MDQFTISEREAVARHLQRSKSQASNSPPASAEEFLSPGGGREGAMGPLGRGSAGAWGLPAQLTQEDQQWIQAQWSKAVRSGAAMATAEELHAKIAGAKRTLEEKKAHTTQLREESTRAEERQRLRRQLEEVQKHISHQESINSGERNYRRLLDADALGNTPSDGSKPFEPPPARLAERRQDIGMAKLRPGPTCTLMGTTGLNAGDAGRARGVDLVQGGVTNGDVARDADEILRSEVSRLVVM
ncbi:unnamed protein product [Effrenium voratum]|uniref:Uncharacterized protein n=1 Tax=Effrenium voratum TaxID=2562239 RepID=A0AA36IU34_9DINO|nr:unnamed protein product [Effrenium voratum]